jgi:hypothetical protein
MGDSYAPGSVITVELGKLIPNGDAVYTANLANARDRWDECAFQDGSWVGVVPLDGEFFLPDGNHRSYVAYFERGYSHAKVTVLEPPMAESVPRTEEYLERARRRCRINRDIVRELGVSCVADLEGRVRRGDWRHTGVADADPAFEEAVRKVGLRYAT